MKTLSDNNVKEDWREIFKFADSQVKPSSLYSSRNHHHISFNSLRVVVARLHLMIQGFCTGSDVFCIRFFLIAKEFDVKLVENLQIFHL